MLVLTLGAISGAMNDQLFQTVPTNLATVADQHKLDTNELSQLIVHLLSLYPNRAKYGKGYGDVFELLGYNADKVNVLYEFTQNELYSFDRLKAIITHPNPLHVLSFIGHASAKTALTADNIDQALDHKDSSLKFLAQLMPAKLLDDAKLYLAELTRTLSLVSGFELDKAMSLSALETRLNGPQHPSNQITPKPAQAVDPDATAPEAAPPVLPETQAAADVAKAPGPQSVFVKASL